MALNGANNTEEKRQPEGIPLYQIDAFTTQPFGGNPAAVCLLPCDLAEARMQDIAAEMNLSETAFLRRIDARPWKQATSFRLRWFTPQTEVDLCGHGTLAAAAALFQIIKVISDTVTFLTRSGELIAQHSQSGITLDFPVDLPQPCPIPRELLGALGINAKDIEETAYGSQTRKLLVHLKESATLRTLEPDDRALLNAESLNAFRGLIVTSRADPPYDFLSRYFAPWVGIPEDPVTGSAHTLLVPYWADRLGKTRLHAYQASTRGGELWGERIADDRVALTGQACVVFKGTLYGSNPEK
jgi:PhzF family phenazine biosynthesis protein